MKSFIGDRVGVGVSVRVGVAEGDKVGFAVLVMGMAVCVGDIVPAGMQLDRRTSKSKIIGIR